MLPMKLKIVRTHTSLTYVYVYIEKPAQRLFRHKFSVLFHLLFARFLRTERRGIEKAICNGKAEGTSCHMTSAGTLQERQEGKRCEEKKFQTREIHGAGGRAEFVLLR